MAEGWGLRERDLRPEGWGLKAEGCGSSFYWERGSVMMPLGTPGGPALWQLALLSVGVARDGQFYHTMQV